MTDWLRRRAVLLVLLAVLAPALYVWHAQHNLASRTIDLLNSARSAQGVAPFAPPAGYYSASPAAQVVAIINNERAKRGLPLGLVSTLDSDLITQSLAANRDPVPIVNVPGVVMSSSIWGWSSMGSVANTAKMGTAVEYIDYSWVYDDGWGGTLAKTTNADCVSLTAIGCNAHRRAILRPNPPGTTLVIIAGGSSNVSVQGDPYGTSAAAELVWTKDPAQFSAHAPAL